MQHWAGHQLDVSTLTTWYALLLPDKIRNYLFLWTTDVVNLHWLFIVILRNSFWIYTSNSHMQIRIPKTTSQRWFGNWSIAAAFATCESLNFWLERETFWRKCHFQLHLRFKLQLGLIKSVNLNCHISILPHITTFHGIYHSSSCRALAKYIFRLTNDISIELRTIAVGKETIWNLDVVPFMVQGKNVLPVRRVAPSDISLSNKLHTSSQVVPSSSFLLTGCN
jgi:hypothetical protein